MPFRFTARRSALLVASLALAAATTAAADGVRLVKDLWPRLAADAPAPRMFVEAGNGAFFVATDSTHGEELWWTDGTPAGTRLTLDIDAGPLGAVRGRANDAGMPPAAVGSLLVFAADDGIHGFEPWVSDGTAAGTRMLADLAQGSESSSPDLFRSVGGRVYFTTQLNSSSEVFWSTDGTPDGTMQVSHRFGMNVNFVVAAQSRLYVVDAGSRLWVLDGMPDGLVQLADRVSGPLAALGDSLLFTRQDPATGLEPWWTDGTPGGTALLLDMEPGTAAAPIGGAVAAGDRVYFLARTSTHGCELWSTDGSAAGTQLVIDLAPGPANGPTTPLVAMRDHVAFRDGDPSRRGHVWTSDGTAAGTRRVDTYCGDSITELEDAVELDAEVVVPVHCRSRARLVRVDGASPTTISALGEVASADGRVVYAARSANGTQPHAWDPSTRVETELVSSLSERRESPFGNFTDFAGRLAFTCEFSCLVSSSEGIYVSDGSDVGTTRAWTPGAGAHGDAASHLTMFGDKLVFRQRTDNAERLVALDDEGAQELLVASAAGVRNGDTLIESVCTAGDRLYFNRGGSLWSSDGSAAGTQALSADEPWSSCFHDNLWDVDNPWGFTDLDGRLLFLSGASSFTACVSDGTLAGSTHLIEPGFNPVMSLSPRFGEVAGGAVFLTSGLGTWASTLLWRTDGTMGGTEIVTTLDGDWKWTLQAAPIEIASTGTVAWFVGRTEAEGRELWRTDGTAAGTWLVLDIWPGPADGLPQELTVVGDVVYFRARDEDFGWELWRSDGTGAGTFRLGDLNPGPRSSHPESLEPMGSGFVFSAHDEAHGQELWISDGTAGGTRLYADILPGPSASCPRESTLSGELVYFIADGGVTGRDLWVIDADRDLDGIADASDPCPLQADVPANDADADGVMDLCDLDALDPSVMRAPLEVAGVLVAKDATSLRLTWDGQEAIAGAAVRYDVVAGSLPIVDAASMVDSMECLEIGRAHV